MNLPSRAEQTLLPASLCTALVALLIFQLFTPPGEALSAALLTGTVVQPVAPPLNPQPIDYRVADPLILTDALFDPARAGGLGDNAVAGPIGGALPVGIIRNQGIARVVMQQADGKPLSLRIGQAYRGWRLAGIGEDQIAFYRDGRTLRLPISGSPQDAAGSERNQLADER